MTRHLKLLIGLLPAVVACATDQDNAERACYDAEQHFASCGLSVPAGFADLCLASPDNAGEVLAMPCDQLTFAIDQLGKSDLPGFGRSEGQACVFNVQCDRALKLVCRPTESPYETTVFSVPHQCLPFGQTGDFCDDRFDCYRGAHCLKNQCDLDYEAIRF